MDFLMTAKIRCSCTSFKQ